MKVFIGSTYEDLSQHRARVREAIDRLRHQGNAIEWLGMEGFSARDQPPLEECLAFVDEADVYVGIFGVRYGSKPRGADISFTEAEFRRASERDIPRLIFLISDDAEIKFKFIERDPQAMARLNALKDELKQVRGFAFFDSPADLAAKVLTALQPHLRRKPARAEPETRADLTATRARYAAHLVTTLDKIDATRIAAALDRTLERIPLTQVYVPLRGGIAIPERDVYERQARVAGRALGDVVGEAEQIARQEQERAAELFLHDALTKYPGLVILGDPGSGKSTFLKYVAVAYAQNEQGTRLKSADPRVPVFLNSAAYAEKMREEKRHLALQDYLPQYYHDRHEFHTDLAPLFQNALAQGRAIVLLDGLDEVKDLAERARIAEQVERFWNHHRAAGNRLVITSRIIGYQRLRAEGLTHVTLHDFSDDDIRAFLRQCCPIIERAIWRETLLLAIGHLSVIQHSPGRAAQLVEKFLGEKLTGDARGQNVVRAGEALRDVGAKGMNEAAEMGTAALVGQSAFQQSTSAGCGRELVRSRSVLPLAQGGNGQGLSPAQRRRMGKSRTRRERQRLSLG
jgi:energy-coupling factor transporter ATP-binding protein EcfA2